MYSKADILNKSSIDKETYYRKKINLLVDIVNSFGGDVKNEYRKSLQFPHFTPIEDPDEALIDSEEGRTVAYIKYLQGVIENNLDKVSPEHKISLIVFQKMYPDYEQFLETCVYKCEDEELQDKPITKKSPLGYIERED